MAEELKESRCFCPYCDEEISLETSPWGKPCPVVLRYCVNCKVAVERELKECPNMASPWNNRDHRKEFALW
jgi:RNA polymerase subunit RPABC4/transcription elongation factor Spt4